MPTRMLGRGALVVVLGVAALLTPDQAEGKSRSICYTCWQGDMCPSGWMGDQICQSIGGDLCPAMVECIEMSSMCPWGMEGARVQIHCGGAP